MSARISELALPKGLNVHFMCEICGEKATTKCEKCKFTHYCSDYHKSIDLKSLHKNVCEIVADIRKEQPLPFTEEDRKEADEILLKKKAGIQALAEITAKRWLMRENGELAYPAAMSALKIAKEINGPNSIYTIYPTCLVSEACLSLGDTKLSQEYAALANWISQKYEIIPPTIFARLQRLTGLVCMKAEKWELAKEAFATYLYTIALEHGTSDRRIANAYGYLGLVLLKFENEEGAMSSFHKMTDKWLDYFLEQFGNRTLREATEEEMATDEKVAELDFQCLESKIVFKLVFVAVRQLGMNPVTDLMNFKILSSQALLKIRDGLPNDAAVYKQEALAIASRTKQDKAVPQNRVSTLKELLGDDYIMVWEKKNNRPRTVATKYLEMIKKIQI